MLRAVAARGGGQPGAPPRHDRRLGRARRPGFRSPGCAAGARSDVRRRGPGGEREIAADQFFTGFLETALAPDELLTEIRVPKTGANGFSYQKFNRRAQDCAIVGALAVQGRTGRRGSALVNMGPTPLRAHGVEDGARGRSIDRRRGGARGRRNRAVRRPQRRRRVPRAPRPGAHRARARGRRRLTGTAVAVLAAGRGSRVGAESDVPKPLLELARSAARRWALDAAMHRACDPAVLVVGHRARAVEQVVPPGVTVVRRAGWRHGIAREPARGARMRSKVGRRSARCASGWRISRASAPRRTAGSPPRTRTARHWRWRRTRRAGEPGARGPQPVARSASARRRRGGPGADAEPSGGRGGVRRHRATGRRRHDRGPARIEHLVQQEMES